MKKSSSTVSALEIYVSPNGRDANNGTKQAPYKTLEKARDAIRELKREGKLPKGGINVLLMGGDHVLTETFVLTPEDSGAKGSPVSYQSAPGEKAIITGARSIEGWKKLTEDVTGLTEQAKGNLFVAEIPKGWRFHYFYVNGVRQQVARWINDDNWHAYPIYRYDDAGINVGPEAPLEHLSGNGDVEMFFVPNEWWNILVTVRNVDPVKRTMDVETKNGVLPAKLTPDWMPHQYNLLNALCLLDQPGDWCVDSEAGRVYYWPPDGTMAGKKAFAPAPNLYNLVRFDGDPENGPSVRYVNFSGLTFSHTDRLEESKWPANWLKRNSESPDGAILMMGVENCEFKDNTILDVGACGLTLAYHVMHVKVVGNEIGRTGSCGIYLYGWGIGKLGVARDNLISRNNIYDVGTAPYWHAAGISLYSSSHNRISHNLVQNMPYAGISIVESMAKQAPPNPGTIKKGLWDADNSYEQFRFAELPQEGTLTPESVEEYLHSDNNTVERNIVYEYMNRLNDGSALYCWAVGINGVWRENIVARRHDTQRTDERAGTANGIYMDDETDQALVEGNLCWGPIGRAWFDNSHGWGAKPIAEMCENTEPPVVASADTSNHYRNNLGSIVEKPAGYDVLLGKIVQDVEKEGGWRGPFVLPT